MTKPAQETQRANTISIEDLRRFLEKYQGNEGRSTYEYVFDDPDAIVYVAQELLDEKLKSIENEPNIVFAEAVNTSPNSILIRELARLLRHNGIKIGQKKLMRYLRKHDYLIEKGKDEANMPTYWALEKGLFAVKRVEVTHSDGTIYINNVVKVTGKGQIHFVNKLLSEMTDDTE